MTEWRIIPSWPEYEASSDGKIRRKATGHILKSCRRKKGQYEEVSLWRNNRGLTCKVHRLVCEAFHGPPPDKTMDAAHHNGVRYDNEYCNLAWKTRKENEADKKRHGLDNAGERNGQARLTDIDVAEIRHLYPLLPRSSGGVRVRKGAKRQLAARYGISVGALYNVATGKAWRHLP